jgi:hypothetical protein
MQDHRDCAGLRAGTPGPADYRSEAVTGPDRQDDGCGGRVSCIWSDAHATEYSE